MTAFNNLFVGTVIPSETLAGLSVDERSSILELLVSGELAIRSGQVSLPVERKTGPRGPTAKVQPRLAACREQLVAFLAEGRTVSATDLLDVAEKRYVYTDIGVVVDELLAEGGIVQTNKGRKLFWSLPTDAAGRLETLDVPADVALPEVGGSTEA
jgi:hypothetical protein